MGSSQTEEEREDPGGFNLSFQGLGLVMGLATSIYVSDSKVAGNLTTGFEKIKDTRFGGGKRAKKTGKGGNTKSCYSICK